MTDAVSLVNITRDVRLAGVVCLSQPTREGVEALRDRLRAHIAVLAELAEAYGRSLSGEWYGRYVLTCVASARKAAAGVEPGIRIDEELLLLAEYVKTLLMYTGRKPRHSA
ncbi:hypothetical protein ACH41E_11025 [Streptomyces sp. NPDC020412]|uniref:hypothetical protein n=1 Tax=Streptomyces sp. NPDC020412 TaxID=3365073 RepID=UPI0037A4D245